MHPGNNRREKQLESPTRHVIARIRPLKGSQLQDGQEPSVAREPQGISMTFKSLLAAGLTLAALSLSIGTTLAQDASSSSAPAADASSSSAAAPAATGDQAAAGTAAPQANWLKICDPGADKNKRACILRQVVVTQ